MIRPPLTEILRFFEGEKLLRGGGKAYKIDRRPSRCNDPVKSYVTDLRDYHLLWGSCQLTKTEIQYVYVGLLSKQGGSESRPALFE
jgi:hypothetical protein